MIAGPFGLSSPEELGALLTGASFEHITIRPAVKILRYPSSQEFLLRYAAGSALASAVASADDHARAELLAKVNAKLQSYIGDRGLAFPIESNIVIARR